MKEPLWKVTLYWGTVVTFFMLPLSVFIVHLLLIGWPGMLSGNAGGHLDEFKYVGEFHRTLAALVFGLAGLQTTQFIATKHFEGRAEPKI